MDYYQLLKVPPNATPKEIEQAYQRLLKESRYNTSISRKDIEAAYRVLIDQKAKQIYDNRQTKPSKTKSAGRADKKKAYTLLDKLKSLTFRQLVWTLTILTVLTTAFYIFRFGYLVKQFEPGDILYYKDSNKRLGKIVRIEENHDFGKTRLDAYLVETLPQKEIWIPQVDIKARCYKHD